MQDHFWHFKTARHGITMIGVSEHYSVAKGYAAHRSLDAARQPSGADALHEPATRQAQPMNIEMFPHTNSIWTILVIESIDCPQNVWI